MDIIEFFQQSEGKWFSQRTSHHLDFNQSESGKSDIRIEVLPKDHAEVVRLCEQCGISPSLALCGARVAWEGTMEWDKSKRHHSTVLVAIANPDNAKEGKLLRDGINGSQSPVTGRYIMGEDDALTFITEHETLYSEERLWFASPNLRLRTSLLKRLDGFSMASFYSEIRMGVAAPAKAS
ncbi:MAG TPA: phycobiliprotein lyase [Synechococcales cyanobacterium M55_K2018_004]|nr:phycobiliprotein lyase [Synechococcales cyanobacterium M55_K2018_004]